MDRETAAGLVGWQQRMDTKMRDEGQGLRVETRPCLELPAGLSFFLFIAFFLLY
jgi:hypothetical protein